MSNKRKAGRPKGARNRIDEAIRAHFEIFLMDASEDIQELFEKLKKESPKQALDAIRDYAEFVLPKLARQEVHQEVTLNISQQLAEMSRLEHHRDDNVIEHSEIIEHDTVGALNRDE